jgi:hypothetical protein
MGERQVLIPRTKVTVVLRQSQNLVIAAKQVNSECSAWAGWLGSMSDNAFLEKAGRSQVVLGSLGASWAFSFQPGPAVDLEGRIQGCLFRQGT